MDTEQPTPVLAPTETQQQAPVPAPTGTQQPVEPKAASANDAKHIISFILLMFLFGFVIFFICAVGSLAMASSACTKEGASDCGAGWAWGFFMLPLSFIISLVLAPILAGLIVWHRKKK